MDNGICVDIDKLMSESPLIRRILEHESPSLLICADI